MLVGWPTLLAQGVVGSTHCLESVGSLSSSSMTVEVDDGIEKNDNLFGFPPNLVL
jgi:hypothetical protein